MAMRTYGEWLDQLAEIIGRKYVPMNGTFILNSYFRRGFTPAQAAEHYNAAAFITGEPLDKGLTR